MSYAGISRRGFPVAAPTLLLAFGLAPVASAQAPDVEKAIYTNACMSKTSGDTQGEGLMLTKSGGGYALSYLDFESIPHPPQAVAKGEIVGDEVSFEASVGDLPIRFSGTISPEEIRGRFSNDRNIEYYNSEVRWQRVLPNTTRPYCK